VLVTATAASTADTSFGLATLSIAVAAPFPDGVPGVRGGAPTDVDDDGRYEDVNGDGRLDFFDVIDLLFADWGRINADPAGRAAFDLDGSGGVGFLDVVHLLFDL
jgi:PKD repeat protein